MHKGDIFKRKNLGPQATLKHGERLIALKAKIEQQYAQMELEAGETHVDEAECLVLALGKTRGHTRGVGRMVKRISRSESSGSSSSNRDTEMDAIKQQMFEMQERMKELEKRNKNPNDNEGGEDEDN
ncbi:hypothetical protein QVD17_32052 [Tagetes erecta]|uniref:Uncharacterized protein n=2 Tax=Tagetes erecta TaxID=13708 RepID=A0AAD8K5J2_TARER|nr:hypothetical protein QVD17_32052 [Tagetes erecta]